MRVLTVSQINFFLKSLIESDGRLTDVYVAGEISNFTDHYRSGHLYFSLKLSFTPCGISTEASAGQL